MIFCDINKVIKDRGGLYNRVGAIVNKREIFYNLFIILNKFYLSLYP